MHEDQREVKMGIARDVHNLIQSKLTPSKPKIANLLEMVARMPRTPMQQNPNEPMMPTETSQQPPVNNMIPDIGKQETNMARNSLMAKHPGLGAK